MSKIRVGLNDSDAEVATIGKSCSRRVHCPHKGIYWPSIYAFSPLSWAKYFVLWITAPIRTGPRSAPSIIGMCLILVVMLSGCAIPEHMRVRAGVDPRNQDDDVRFRTVYYFRTFDACFEIDKLEGEVENRGADVEKAIIVTELPFYIKTTGKYKLLTDSLYRFRMTGKANPLFSAVHFESGTLRASEIDPFGANVEFDQDSRRFRFVSRQETENRVRRRAIYREIKILDEKARDFGARTTNRDPKELNDAEEEMLKGIKGRITQLWQKLALFDGKVNSENLRPIKTAVCSNGTVARRGFQVLGPEGWRTFNQDERLILAMSISGKPLISALKELSGRVLNEKSSSSDSLLNLAHERVRISKTERLLDRLNNELKSNENTGENPKNPDLLVKEVLSAFSPGETGQ